MENLKNFETTALNFSELEQIDGGKMTLNQARAVAFLIGGVGGLLFFELGRNS